MGKVSPRDENKLARVREWQRAIIRHDTLPAIERALAGRSLAVLGDPRPEVMTLDNMHFCLVPPGPFAMGSDDVDEEKPQHIVDVAYPYFIGRFPVTVAQWREYIELSGAAAEDEDSLRGRDNDPVTNVSWHEAIRFCGFLSDAWRRALPQGFVVTLPSEAEWEKAARGGEQIPHEYEWVTLPGIAGGLAKPYGFGPMRNPFPTRDYPWGPTFDADKANSDLIIGETSAVGCCPLGFSPYGCEDMAGNVWEWTRSLWGKDWQKPDFPYPYQPDDSHREDLDAGNDVWRVLRGGSFDGGRDGARCASRRGSSRQPRRRRRVSCRVAFSPVHSL